MCTHPALAMWARWPTAGCHGWPSAAGTLPRSLARSLARSRSLCRICRRQVTRLEAVAHGRAGGVAQELQRQGRGRGKGTWVRKGPHWLSMMSSTRAPIQLLRRNQSFHEQHHLGLEHPTLHPDDAHPAHLVLRLLAVVHARHLGRAVQVAHKRKRVHVALARLHLRQAARGRGGCTGWCGVWAGVGTRLL